MNRNSIDNSPRAGALRLWLGRALAGCLFATAPFAAGQTVLFQESFETDGLGTRYKAQNQNDNNANQYFNRRENASSGVRARGGSIDGNWHWSGRNINGQGVPVDDLEAFEARLWLAPIDISGFQDLEIVIAAAQGGNEFEFDDRIMVQYRFDGGDEWLTRGEGESWTSTEEEEQWITAGGFRGRHTNSPAWYFEGDAFTVPPFGTGRLTRAFDDFSWRLWGQGDKIEIRIFMKMNGSTEEYHVDNIRLVGTPGLGSLTPSLNKDSFTETEGAGAGELTINIDPAAPAGGLLVNIENTDTRREHVGGFPANVAIPEGQTSVVIPFDIVHDQRFSGDPMWRFQFTAEGYGRSEATYQVINVDPRPRLLITELHPSVAGGGPNRLVGPHHYSDANGDGFRHGAQDEFAEIINLEDVPVDMSFWTTIDDLGTRHIFPEGTILQPGEVLVLFGGGVPTGKFGGAHVQTSSLGNLGLGNGGDNFSIIASGALVRELVYDGVLGLTLESIVIPPEQIFNLGFNIDEGGFGPGTGGAYVKMSDVHPDSGPPRPADSENDIGSGAGPFFAPGYFADGSGRPLMNWGNELHVSLSSPDAVEPEQFNAHLAVPEGSMFEITITLDQPAGDGGVLVDLEAIETRSIYIPPTAHPLLTDIIATDRAGPKVVFFENPVRVQGTGPVTVQGMVLATGQPDGKVVGRIFAHADGVLFGFADLEIIDVAFDPVDITINEVFGGVTGSGMDPNRNGLNEEPVDDQYIEIVNSGNAIINLSGWRLLSWSTRNQTAEELVHIFPAGTFLNPGAAILVFGGGDEAAMNGMSGEHFGGARIQVANVGGNGVNMREDFDGFVQLQNRFGKVMETIYYPRSLAGQGMALTRSPDLTGPWADDIQPPQEELPAPHLDVSEAFELFSPGRQLNGQPFPGSAAVPHLLTAVYTDALFLDHEGWSFVPAWGWIFSASYPWTYHLNRDEWRYTVPAENGAGGLFEYSLEMDRWFFVQPSLHPWYYDFAENRWMYAM